MSNNSDESDSIDDTPGLIVANAKCTESGDGCFDSDEDCTDEIREEPRPRQNNDEKRWRARQRSRRSRATLSLAVMATEYVWLWDVRHGVGMNEIAMREGVTYRRVRQGVTRARALERAARVTLPWWRPSVDPAISDSPTLLSQPVGITGRSRWFTLVLHGLSSFGCGRPPIALAVAI